MKAITQDRYGSPDELRLSDVPTPEPSDNEVLVRVHAAAINAYDWHAMRGDPYLARLTFGIGAPKRKIRGRDFAGRVAAVGRDVTRLQPGDEVYGDTGRAEGTFAEYVSVPESLVEAKPAELSFERAAAVPLAANTALMGLRDVGQVQPGQHVLINGASGGVGTFAVQIAKWLGAEVTAVCSTRNVKLVKSLGADHVIDYTKEDFTKGSFDAIFDLVGNRSLAELRRALGPTGTIVLAGGGVFEGGSLVGPMRLVAKGRLANLFVRHRVALCEVEPGRENLATLRELIDEGRLTPSIDRTYPLSETAEAIRYVEAEHARAKVILTV